MKRFNVQKPGVRQTTGLFLWTYPNGESGIRSAECEIFVQRLAIAEPKNQVEVQEGAYGLWKPGVAGSIPAHLTDRENKLWLQRLAVAQSKHCGETPQPRKTPNGSRGLVPS